jgi:hypothetical protein
MLINKNYWPGGGSVIRRFKYQCWLNVINKLWQELLVFTISETGFQLKPLNMCSQTKYLIMYLLHAAESLGS